MRFLRLWLCAIILIPVAGAQAAPVRAAFFGFKLRDTSGGNDTAENARLHMLDKLMTGKLRDRGYQVVSTAPVASELKRQDMLNCETCAADFARQLGAQIAVVGWVQKVSNLILNVDLVIRDASTNKVLRAGSVSIRSNTDESWRRGLEYLLAERIFPKGEAIPQ